jgi:SOS-response transcriptional repressor LexA
MEIIKHCRRDRVLLLIKDRFDGNKAAFAKAIGRPAPNVHRMLAIGSGKDQRGIGEDLARDIEKTLGLPHLWLDQPTEIGISSLANIRPITPPKFVTEDTSSATASSVNVSETLSVGKRVPLISWVQAGNWSQIADYLSPGDGDDWLPVYQEVGKHTFALVIKGDSMQPEFHDGDTIIVDPDVLPGPGDYVVAKNSEEEATFKKYRPRGLNEKGESYFELIPLNEDYEPMRSDFQKIKIIGTAVDHIRRLRRRGT